MQVTIETDKITTNEDLFKALWSNDVIMREKDDFIYVAFKEGRGVLQFDKSWMKSDYTPGSKLKKSDNTQTSITEDKELGPGKWKKTTIRDMTGEVEAYKCSLCGGTCQWKHKVCPICKGEMIMDE